MKLINVKHLDEKLFLTLYLLPPFGGEAVNMRERDLSELTIHLFYLCACSLDFSCLF